MQADVPAFNEKDIVYHVTEDVPGVVTGLLYQAGTVKYQVTWQGRIVDYHFASELTHDRPYFLKRSDDSSQV